MSGEPRVPITLLLAALADTAPRRDLSGPVDVAAELHRLGLDGVSCGPQVGPFLAHLAAYGRRAPDGLVPAAALARALYGADDEANRHCLRMLAYRARDVLARGAGPVRTVVARADGRGWRLGRPGEMPRHTPGGPAPAPAPGGALLPSCRECGRACSYGAARCLACWKAREAEHRAAAEASLPRCAECGAPCKRGATRCAGCYRARQRAVARVRQAAEAPRCPDCDGPKHRKAARCMDCARAAARAARLARRTPGADRCPACGYGKRVQDRACRSCRDRAARGLARAI